MPFTPPRPGQIMTPSLLSTLTPTYADWSPSWSTQNGTNNPSFGTTSTLACTFSQAGEQVTGTLDITFGSNASFGTGTLSDNWMFTLPVATAMDAGTTIGWVAMRNNANGPMAMGRIRVADATHMLLSVASGRVDGSATVQGDVDSLAPWTWVVGGSLNGSFAYQLG
ncbi:hypothetical protein ACWENS_05650 [Streptomyces sp. NPDC004532]